MSRRTLCGILYWVVLVGWIPNPWSVAFTIAATIRLGSVSPNVPCCMSLERDDGETKIVPPNDSVSNEEWMDKDDANETVQRRTRRNFVINTVASGLLVASGVASAYLFQTSVYTPPGFVRYPSIQFIAALGDPNASRGTMDQPWGLWPLDPGPRGVWLRDYESLQGNDPIVTPSGWTLDPRDWWLEEHGIIMESPQFPLAPGRYLVTGGRRVVTGLTIHATTWQLDDDHVLYDVTHLPCRAARYTTTPMMDSTGVVSPAAANPRDFPVAPGATMPSVPNCLQQDYAVLFVLGRQVQS